MKAFGLALAAIASLASTAAGQAQPVAPAAVTCVAPLAMPPESQRPGPLPTRPAIPTCVDQLTHMSRCRHGEVDRYDAAMVAFNSGVDAWNNSARRYVDDINSWVRSVTDYSRCEIDAMNAETRATQ
ncbi:MAG: hypothetical protein ACHP84_17205 [Caulobacterales bacterium]